MGRGRSARCACIWKLWLQLYIFGSREEDVFAHYCCVEEGSEEHAAGMPIGSPCCADEDECLSKVVVPIVNWLAHPSWESASSNRWTKTVVTLRRVLAGF